MPQDFSGKETYYRSTDVTFSSCQRKGGIVRGVRALKTNIYALNPCVPSPGKWTALSSHFAFLSLWILTNPNLSLPSYIVQSMYINILFFCPFILSSRSS